MFHLVFVMIVYESLNSVFCWTQLTAIWVDLEGLWLDLGCCSTLQADNSEAHNPHNPKSSGSMLQVSSFHIKIQWTIIDGRWMKIIEDFLCLEETVFQRNGKRPLPGSLPWFPPETGHCWRLQIDHDAAGCHGQKKQGFDLPDGFLWQNLPAN